MAQNSGLNIVQLVLSLIAIIVALLPLFAGFGNSLEKAFLIQVSCSLARAPILEVYS